MSKMLVVTDSSGNGLPIRERNNVVFIITVD